MDPWYAKTVILLASVAMVVIRAPYGQRSKSVPVVSHRKNAIEAMVLIIAWLAYLLPIVWVFFDVFRFADYPLNPLALVVGTVLLVIGLLFFWKTHRDLGRQWSISLELRENHSLITDGVYRRVRHPMYTALLVYGAGQALAVPNFFVGPSYLLAIVLLLILRLSREEQMMIDQFGDEYRSYMARTKRLIPGLW